MSGQTEPAGNGTLGTGADEDFLTRERVALGEDAAQFASAGDNAAAVEDGEDDLLGGGGGSYGGAHAGGEEITEFESSFPAMDSQNQVSLVSRLYPVSLRVASYLTIAF